MALSPTGDDVLPRSERVMRELAPLRNDPERLRSVWRALHSAHGDEVRAEDVRRALRAAS